MRHSSVLPLAGVIALAMAGSALAQEGGRISVGASLEGELTGRDPTTDDGSHYDGYRFQARAGERVAISLESDSLDPVLIVGRQNRRSFEELARNDDAPGRGLNSRLVFTAPETGAYAIRATSLDESLGAYRLGLTAAPAAPAATPLTLPANETGELQEGAAVNDDGAPAAFYRFSGRAGQHVSITLESSDFDAYLVLRSAGGPDALDEDDDGAGDGTNARISRALAADGDYVIEARALTSEEVGRYRLRVEETPPPPAPVEAGFGRTVEGEIADADAQADNGARYDAYRFNGREGQRVQAVLRSGDFDAYLEIGSADGSFEVLASDDDGLGEGTDARLNLTLPADGDYVVRAMPLGPEERGLYSLELIDRGPEPEPGVLVVGETARGTLSGSDATTEEGAAFDAYRFQAKKDEKLQLTLVSNAFDAFIDVGRQAQGEPFESLATDDDGLSDTHARLSWTAPEDGDYVVRARSFGPNATGAYALTIERKP